MLTTKNAKPDASQSDDLPRQGKASRAYASVVKKKTKALPSVEGQVKTTSSIMLESALDTRESNMFLRVALVVSVVFHLFLLTIKFAGPEAIDDFFRNSPLDVILINAHSDEVPTNPQVLAQHNYAGGGDIEDKSVHASSPLVHSNEFSEGDSFEEIQASLNEARQESIRLLTQVKAQYAQLPPIDPSWGQNDPRRIAEEKRRLQLANAIAAIEQRIREENARPRRMYIGPAARSDAQAMYYDTIRQRIELKGTDNFPQYAGVPLYGSLLMQIIVNPKGQMVEAKIMQTSGNAVLDRQARTIAMQSGPFARAPEELLKTERNVEFVFIMRFNFLNEGKLTTELMERVNP